MKDVLLVLNPRRIRACLDAIRALHIDRCWIRNLTEPQIAEAWPEILQRIDGYARAFIVSDDTPPHQPALELIQGLLDSYPVATGYCNLAAQDFRVNLCPLPYPDTSVHMTLEQVQMWPTETVPTSFAGFSLTGMSVDLWRRYPYKTTEDGWGADQTLCERLATDGVPIVAHRSAFMWHCKAEWSKNDHTEGRGLLIGNEPASIELELH